MSKFNIESGIPIPPVVMGRKKFLPMEQLFTSMKIGDSVVLPLKKQTHLHRYRKELGLGLLSRSISKKECRVWRTATDADVQ